jgi:branched-chain amino acid transport system substrate-binding protein
VIKLRSRRALVGLALLPVLVTVAACGSSSSKASSPGASSGSSGSATATKSTIVIGNVGNYSGAGEFGPQYLEAAHSLEAWATFTNAHGGINGHPVKVISKDDGSSPSQSLVAVKDLIQNEHAVIIASPVASGTDPAWADYVKAEKVPVIGGLSLDENWSTNPYMLSTNVSQVGFVTGQFIAAKNYGSKVGVLACAELAACKTGIPLFQGIAKSIGLGFASATLVSASAVNYTAPCAQLKQGGADVIVPELDGPTTKRVVDSCAGQGFKPALVLPAADLDATALADDAFNGAVGVTVSPLWFGDSSVTADWKTAYKAQFPSDVLNGYSTLGWQAGVVIAAALKNAPDTVTGQTVLDGLAAQPAGSTFGGWTPPLTFTAGKSSTSKACLWYIQVKDKVVTAPKGQDAVCPAS